MRDRPRSPPGTPASMPCGRRDAPMRERRAMRSTAPLRSVMSMRMNVVEGRRPSLPYSWAGEARVRLTLGTDGGLGVRDEVQAPGQRFPLRRPANENNVWSVGCATEARARAERCDEHSCPADAHLRNCPSARRAFVPPYLFCGSASKRRTIGRVKTTRGNPEVCSEFYARE